MIARREMYISVAYFILFLTWNVSGSVVHKPAFKEALEEHLKEVDHKEGAEAVKFETTKGQKDHQVESVLSDSHKNHDAKTHEEAKFSKKDHDKKSSHESDAYTGHNAKQDKVEESAANGLKRGHKKGHQKQGFQNSYHKDESSSKSTFFDDINDEGDQAQHNTRLNSYDNQGGRSYHGAHNNGQNYELDNYVGKGHSRYDDTGLKQISHLDHGKHYHLDDVHNHNRYQDDRNIYDRNKVHDHHVYRAPPPPPPPPPVHHDPGWDWQTWEHSRRGWDEPGWGRDYGYESRPDVAQIPANAPVLAQRKQTVTIYEDPRYEGKDKGQLRKEEGDYLQLDYKPASHRKYASYDDTYYNTVPANEQVGSMESSKVNRLVYNYRRQ